MEDKSHEDFIQKVSMKVFGQMPEHIERMKIGTGNEVYSIQIGNTGYIVRLSSRDSLKGSAKYIPLFKSKGIQVPDIVAEDYTKKLIPWNYQIQTKLNGTDISNVIEELSSEQLEGTASHIADIAKKLIVLPTNGKYGWIGIDDSKQKTTWKAVLEDMLSTIRERGTKTGVVQEKYFNAFQKALNKYDTYISSAPSQFYFDDMSSKNVMIDKGVFVGLVDLDGVAYGDYLEGIGRIKGSWYGTDYGTIYSEAVMKELGLSESQKEIVTLYALLNRIQWLAETGIQFNQNTSTAIDQEKVTAYENVIDALIEELKLN